MLVFSSVWSFLFTASADFFGTLSAMFVTSSGMRSHDLAIDCYVYIQIDGQKHPKHAVKKKIHSEARVSHTSSASWRITERDFLHVYTFWKIPLDLPLGRFISTRTWIFYSLFNGTLTEVGTSSTTGGGDPQFAFWLQSFMCRDSVFSFVRKCRGDPLVFQQTSYPGFHIYQRTLVLWF